jgi:hypothetical protein
LFRRTLFSLFELDIGYVCLVYYIYAFFSQFRITSRGISISLPASEIKPENKIFREADFLLFYPMKTIYDPNSMVGEGCFAVSATLNGCIEDENWWYPEPTVHKLKPKQSNSVNNGSTVDYVYHLAPRYTQAHIFSYDTNFVVCF